MLLIYELYHKTVIKVKSHNDMCFKKLIWHLCCITNIQAVPTLKRESVLGMGVSVALHVGNPVSITLSYSDLATA